MSLGSLPFNEKPYKNVSGVSNSSASERYVNGILVKKDTGGFVSKRRPGLLLFKDIASSAKIDGTYWWQNRGILIVVSNGVVYKITDSTGTIVNLGGVSLNTNVHVSFAEASYGGINYLFMANGSQIAYTNGTAPVAYIADIDSPTNCSFISSTDQYLVANDTSTDKFYYSNVGDPFNWSNIDFATAESSFDSSQGQVILDRNIVIFGQDSVEFWYNDGATPFKRRNDIFINQGTLTPYTIVKTSKGIFFLNSNREVIVLSSTGVPVKVSEAFDLTFQGLTDTQNAFADNYIVGGKGFYVITFPTDSKTYAYDYINDYWAEWAYWSGSDFARYRGNTYTYAADWNMHIVGDYNDDKLYKCSFNYYDDNGTLMKWLRVTGNVHHGVPAIRKQNIFSSIIIKSGHTITGDAMPYYMYRRNYDKRGWSNQHLIPAQTLGNEFPINKLWRQGIYMMMQHELSCTDAIDIEIVEAVEKYKVLS